MNAPSESGKGPDTPPVAPGAARHAQSPRAERPLHRLFTSRLESSYILVFPHKYKSHHSYRMGLFIDLAMDIKKKSKIKAKAS